MPRDQENARRLAREAHNRQKDNPEYRAKKAANARAWAERNRERVQERNRLHYQANREELLAKNKAWRDANPERAAANHQAWREKNRDLVAAQGNARRARRSVGGDLTGAEWREILAEFEYRCAYCHEDEVELHLEHARPLARGGRHTRWNVVPACASCNLQKGTKTALEYRMRAA